MGGLPRPDLAPGPHRELVDVLHSLHHRAGWPSLRRLAAQTGVSHTTVSKAMSSPALPAWGVAELLVEALGGDVPSAHELWLAASSPDPVIHARERIAGRRDELAAVRSHVEAGSGLLLVTGEAGIGKSTLVEAALAPVDTFVAVGHCLPLSREMPLMPFVDALRMVHDHDGGEWMQDALSRCPDYVRRSLARLVPELDPEAAGPPDDPWGLERLYASVSSALRALATVRPLVVHFEDCHWADRSTLDLLAHLASVPSRPPTVVTWRTADPDVSSAHSDWLSRARWAGSTTAVDLLPLTLQETAEQLRILRGVSPDDALAERIQARTRGLPLYTAQLAGDPDEDGLPRQLADLLDRRIGDLDDDAWRVARVLGLAQRRVGPTVVRTATGLDPESLSDALRVLAVRRLLRATSGEEAELAHPLLVDAIERRLVPGEGAEVHAHIAEALTSAPGVPPGELADHWRAAGRPEREFALRVAAGRRADKHLAHQEALGAWIRVLELVDAGHGDDSLQPWEVLVHGLDAANGAGDLETGRRLAARGEALSLTDAPRAQVAQRVGSLLYDAGDVARADELLAEALALLDREPPSRELVRVLDDRAWTFIQSGRQSEARTEVDRMVRLLDEHPELGSRRRAVAALIAVRADETNDVDASLALARIPDGVQQPDDPVAELMIAANVTDVLLRAGAAPARVEDGAQQSIDTADEWDLGLSFLAVLVRSNICWAHLIAGDTAAARRWIAPVALSRPTANTAFGHLAMAAVEVREGRLSEALDRARRADVEIPNRNENWAEWAPWWAEAQLWADEPGAAVALLEAALGPRLKAEAARQAAPLLVMLARSRADLLSEAGAGTTTRRAAMRDLEVLVACASSDPFVATAWDVSVPALAASWQAELARGGMTQSLDAWIRAATAWDDVGRRHDAAYSRWRAAQVARQQGRGTVATRLLTRAATDARGHVPLSEAIAATEHWRGGDAR